MRVDALARSTPDPLEAGADVNQSIVPGVPHPVDLVDVLRQLPEAFLGFVQRFLGPPALVGHDATPGPMQGLAQAADDRTDQEEKD